MSEAYIRSLYKKLWQDLGLQFSVPENYSVCEDEAYRQLTDVFRKMSRELENDIIDSAPPAANRPANSPIDAFANKIKGVVLDSSSNDDKKTSKTEKTIDCIFGAIKKSIKDAVAADRSKTDNRNGFLNKVVGALEHVVTDVPAVPLPSGIGDRIAQNYKKVFDAFVPPHFREQAICLFNKLPQFCHARFTRYRPTARAPQRRTIDSDLISTIFESYFFMQYYDCNMIAYMNASSHIKSIYSMCSDTRWYLSPLVAGSDLIAAAIDMDEPGVISYIKRLFSDNCQSALSTDIVRGIIKSDNKELIDLLISLLLNAGLQEGVRQCICENMDVGSFQTQTAIFRAIYDNNLIRFSSVKRALATQTGIEFDSESLERIFKKEVQCMHEVIENQDICYQYIHSNDPFLVKMGFWGLGIRDVQLVSDEVAKIIREGTREQIIAAAHNLYLIKDEGRLMDFAKTIIGQYPDDRKVMDAWFPYFINNIYGVAHEALYSKGPEPAFHARKVSRKCAPIPLEPYFDSLDEVRKYIDILNQFWERTPKDSDTGVTRSGIVYRLFVMAWMLKDADLLGELGPRYNEAGEDWRKDCLLMATWNPHTRAQKKVLFEAAVSRTEEIGVLGEELLKLVSLDEEDYDELRELFRLKSIGARNYLSDLFYEAPEPTMLHQIAEMLQSKKKEIRSAGLDLIVRLKDDKERRDVYIKARNLANILAKPSAAEKIVIDSILGQNDVDDILNTPGYGLYNPDFKTHLPPFHHQPGLFKVYIEFWKQEVPKTLKKLDELIEANKDLEYFSIGRTHKLGAHHIYAVDLDQPDYLSQYPFPELWQQFYDEEIREFALLLVIRCLISARNDRSIEDAKNVYGVDISGVPYPVLKYEQTIDIVTKNLYRDLVPNNMQLINDLFGSIAYAFVAQPFGADFELDEEKVRNKSGDYNALFINLTAPVVNAYLDHCFMDGQNYFITFETINRFWGSNVMCLSFVDYILAYHEKIISRDEVYQAIFDKNTIFEALETMSHFLTNPVTMPKDHYYGGRNALRDFLNARDETSFWRMPLADEIRELYWPLVDMMLKVELKRSEQSTVFSRAISCVPLVRGTKTLVDILIALNGEKLVRDAYYHWNSCDSKAYCLSSLLLVSEPAPRESVNTLRECLKEHPISNERLIEVAMFNDRWAPMIEQYLGWDGLVMGIAFFVAQSVEEFSDRQKCMIARYTPIAPEDLSRGAMDIQWFKEAYERLGADHFELLYQSAKYVANSNKHIRARKYADAALGKYTIEETENEIREKRNRDLLMAYPLIPLRDDEDIKRRYLFIQKFRNEGKRFGAQRGANEVIAADMAIRNLASHAGFEDETRLIMRMESEINNYLNQFFEWTAIEEDVKLRIAQSDEDYSLSIECQKAGKPLKSVPAKYKNHEKVTEFKAALKTMREQFSHTKRMCEEFMENGTELGLDELQILLGNRIAGPILSKIVYLLGDKSIHYFEHAFDNPQGIKFRLSADAKLRIAHPYDLYKNGDWAFYQKYIFDHQIKQPFRQVFRELYLLTDEEREMIYSLRFAGNQIKTRQTVGCLKGRRWGASYEDGLQKIYYRENIIATIYAEADWFSPSDIEPPTLEYVVFFDRETHEELELQEVPPIIFSEVMRDVDMAVSVAHAGDVDPETSHSTIEMRRIIAEYNVQLFGLKNVSFDARHARIEGKRASYTIHLGSGTIFEIGGSHIAVLPVHSQHKGRLFLPFIDEDPKTAEIMSKILLFANDMKIKDPYILRQL